MSNIGRLHNASIQGDNAALSELLKQDPLLVDIYYICSGHATNVLHIAAILGHSEFFGAILQHKSSCLNYLCLARDENGRNPIHVAAMGGRLSILNLIKDHDALIQAARQRADRGGTILHLCVQSNQPEALKLLLEIFPNPDFTCARDEDGMTIVEAAGYHQFLSPYLIFNLLKLEKACHQIENHPGGGSDIDASSSQG